MHNTTEEAYERFQENLDELRQMFDYERNIIATVREPLLVLDARLMVISANRSFYTTFHVSPDETEGQFLYAWATDNGISLDYGNCWTGSCRKKTVLRILK